MSPDRRQHRGAHPDDRSLFSQAQIGKLREATSELSWLLTHGYSAKSALKLVGDRHSLTDRQRVAVSRAACSDQQRAQRRAACLSINAIANQHLAVDGFNLIISVEAAMSGAVLIACRDGCIRDLSSVHGSYRSVLETQRAICLIGEALEPTSPASAHWVLDKPISNSGRLAVRIRELAASRGWPWDVELAFNPDAVVLAPGRVIVTSDSVVLDKAARWVNLAGHLVEKWLDDSWVVDLNCP